MKKIKTSTVVGTPTLDCWSQAQFFSSERGGVGIVVQVERKEGGELIDLVSIGSSIVEGAKEEMVTEEGVISGMGEGIKASLAMIKIEDERVKITGNGEIETYLVRGGKLAKLGEATELERGIVGKLIEGDTLIVMTMGVKELVGEEKLQELCRGGEEAAEAIAPQLHGKEDSSRAAGLMISYEREEKSGIGVIMARLTERPIRVRGWSEGPQKLNVGLAVFALIFLIIMVGLGLWKRQVKVRQEAYSAVKEQVEQQIGEARSVADLNPGRAEDLLNQAGEAAQGYTESQRREQEKTKGAELVRTVNEAKESIFKVNKTALTKTIELSVLASGLSSKTMMVDSVGTAMFPDTNNNRVVAMNIDDKSRIVIETGEIGKVKSLAVFDKKIYGLVDSGVAELNQDETKNKIVIEPDELWGNVVQVESYAGNLYLLDLGTSEIWKYPVITDGFGTRKRWLGPGIALDLSKVVQMRVTGDVWIITKSGKLERYSRGVPVKFTLEGVPGGEILDDPTALWVGETAVYIVEKGKARMIVLGLDGKYQAQYLNEELTKATDLVVYKNKAYVLIENEVKEFGL